jgi:hypothetical protein
MTVQTLADRATDPGQVRCNGSERLAVLLLAGSLALAPRDLRVHPPAMQGMRAWPSTLAGVAIILGILAGLVAGLGIVFVGRSESDDPLRVIGTWLLQLSLVFAGTGVVSLVVRQSEVSRARREAWAESLHQLIGAHDEVQMASRLLSAHATAKTYAEQIKVLTSARGTLRRLASSPGVYEYALLHDELMKMRSYLKDLIKEYQQKYLRVARQQRLDELVLDYRLKSLAAADEQAFHELPDDLGKPLPAGLALQDPDQFPFLNDFRTSFKVGAFRSSYEAAKPLMQQKAGLPPGNVHGVRTRSLPATR